MTTNVELVATNLEHLRAIRDHFVKHFDHAEDWIDDCDAHRGCLLMVRGRGGAIAILRELGNHYMPEEPGSDANFLAIDSFVSRLYDKNSLLRDIERAIARLEEKEAAPVAMPETASVPELSLTPA